MYAAECSPKGNAIYRDNEPCTQVEPDLVRLVKDLEKTRLYNAELITQIEDHVGRICSFGQQSGTDCSPEQPLTDFFSAVNREINWLVVNNERLVRIRTHLQKLI